MFVINNLFPRENLSKTYVIIVFITSLLTPLSCQISERVMWYFFYSLLMMKKKEKQKLYQLIIFASFYTPTKWRLAIVL